MPLTSIWVCIRSPEWPPTGTGTLTKGPIHHQIISHISKTRFEQIDRWFHIFEPRSQANTTQNPVPVFEKLEPLASELRRRFRRTWDSGTHLTIDEAIARFMGRAKEIVNIPKKPTPEGFKIWTLANSGYILDWRWHAKGSKANEGPINIDSYWVKTFGFSKTQAVVLDLLAYSGLAKGQHICWMDILFNSEALLVELRWLGFGAAGTVRTSTTKREEIESSQGEPAQKRRISEEKDRGLDRELVDLKNNHGFQLEWGKLYIKVSPRDIIQFAWKDNNVVTFMSTVADPKASIVRRRRRPAATSTSAKTSWAVFGDETTKELPIPEFIDLYNHFMNGVNTADQLRSYYSTQRVHIKNWKPLWHWLLDTTITNAYKRNACTSTSSRAFRSKNSSHFDFRMKLANELFERSQRQYLKRPHPPPKPAVEPTQKIAPSAHEFVNLPDRHQSYCVVCKLEDCTSTERNRKALKELNPNSLRRGARRKRGGRTRFWCEVCDVPVCTKPECREQHRRG